MSALRRIGLAALAASWVLACGGSAVESGPSGGAQAGSGGASAGGAGANAGSAGDISMSPDLQVCASNADCVVVPQGCCNCGRVDLGAYTAINSKYADAYAARCGNTGCGCPLSLPSGPDYPELYFVPTCRAGRCAVVDLGSTDITSCKTAADCVLRSGTGCCQGCGESAVAINSNGEGELKQLVCGTEPVACGHCVATYMNLGVDCMATTDGSEADQNLLPGPRCVVISTGCTPANPCTL